MKLSLSLICLCLLVVACGGNGSDSAPALPNDNVPASNPTATTTSPITNPTSTSITTGGTISTDSTTTAISSDTTNTTISIPPPAHISLRGSINEWQDILGYWHYFGEMINDGGQPACFVKITVNALNSSGSITDTDYSYVYGSPRLLTAIGMITNTCLAPGEFGGFNVWTIWKTRPASYTTTIDFSTSNSSPPPVSPSLIIISGSISEGTEASSGYKTLSGFIKNNSSSTVSFVEISFVGLNGSTVVATDFSYITGSACSTNSTDTCLGPGQMGSFTVTFLQPPENITSYYYKISYDIP